VRVTRTVWPIVLAISLLAGGVAQAAADVQINSDVPGSVQNEVRIAINPTDPNNLVVAYNDNIGQASTPLGISFTLDGGTTWADRQLSVPKHPIIGSLDDGIALPNIFDPFIDSGPAGDIYAGYIANDGTSGGPGGLFIERSTDKGQTWFGPTTISFDLRAAPPGAPTYRFNDRPDMTVDTTGNVLVVSIKDVGMSGPTSDIYFAQSPAPVAPSPASPTGLDFTGTGTGSVASKTINDGPNGTDWANVPDVVVASDGTIYVSWINVDVTNPGAKPGQLMLDRSSDNGSTFGTDTTVLSINALPNALSTAAGLTDAKSGSYPVIGVDPQKPAHVYLAYAADPLWTDEADIFFIRSTDGGFTWTAPIRVNDDATTNDQFHPMLAVNPAGTIAIAWYDKRNAPSDDQWDVYWTTSSDGGLTFAANGRISDASFATPADIFRRPWMGEYLGLELDTSTAYFAFTSSAADGYGDLFFDTTALPAAPKRCAGFIATRVGTPGADTLIGTGGPDVIVARGGDDTINGLGGDDIICGNGGNDVIVGGPGDDRLIGGWGHDTISGRRGSDRIYGNKGADRLRGGGGADVIRGGIGHDVMSGGTGPDKLKGHRGDDRLSGGSGIDLLDGGPGTDTCTTGEILISC